MPAPGNFRRRRRSNRAVKPSWTTHARQRVEAWPLRFFAVVLGVALAFRVGIGWARALTHGPDPGADGAETASPATPRPRVAGPLRAESGGTATALAVLGGRARALGSVRVPAAPRDHAGDTPPERLAAMPRGEAARPPSPSFLRARREFEHRHADDDPSPTRPAPKVVPVSARPRARRE